jgi:regulatory protein
MSDFTISKIVPQKKNKNRFSIFTKNKFLLGISNDTLLKYGLQVGSIITPDLLFKLQENEELISLKNSALRFLTRRPHSVKELKDKLIKKSKKPELIGSIVEEFILNNYLNDENFAFAFFSDEIRLKKSGPLLIKKKLLQKGINPEIVDKILENDYDIDKQINNCSILANKKLNVINRTLSFTKIKTKLATYLKQKGYNWDIIKNVIESLNLGENDEN